MAAKADISEVYASQLENLEKGYALWFPEGYNDSDEIGIGDVGYIKRGTFVEVFKARYTFDDTHNERNVQEERVPPLHQPIPKEALKKVLVREQYMKPDLDLPGLAGGRVGYSLTFREKRGAWLYIPQTGIETATETSYGLIEYMKKHHDHWYDHVAGSGPLHLDIGRSDLIMIQGFVKTPAFAMAAARSGSTSHSGTAEANAVTFASLSLHVEYSLAQQSGMETREPELDDSYHRWPIFIRYLQVRWRIPGIHTSIKLVAGAGPHELPKDPDAGGQGGPAVRAEEDHYEYEIESNLPETSAHSWVDILLDYLLENSDAAMAIASHGDVYSLFPEGSPPEDFRVYLDLIRPKIRVDSDNAAMLDLLELINHHRNQEINGEEAALGFGMGGGGEGPGNNDDADRGNENDARARYGGLVLRDDAPGSEPRKWAHLTIMNKDGSAGTVTSMAVSPDGTQVAASYEDNVIQLWDAKTGMLITSLDGSDQEGAGRHEASVWTTVYSPDGKYLASGGEDGRILVWAAQDIPQEDSTTIRRGKAISKMEAHDIDVWKLAFSSDGETIASGSVGGEVKLWNALTGHCKHELSGHLA
ncbi:WD40 repeat-like protein, partial [Trametopsis cervina]